MDEGPSGIGTVALDEAKSGDIRTMAFIALRIVQPPNGLELPVPCSPSGDLRLYGKLPGGSGNGPPIIAHPGRQGSLLFPHASRVSRRPFVPDALIGILVSFQGCSLSLCSLDSPPGQASRASCQAARSPWRLFRRVIT